MVCGSLHAKIVGVLTSVVMNVYIYYIYIYFFFIKIHVLSIYIYTYIYTYICIETLVCCYAFILVQDIISL